MHLETLKSFILWVLVGISLVLSFALWSFTPDTKQLPQNAVEEGVNLGGSEQTIKDLIEPSSIIFENNNTYYGFTDPNDRKSLYQDIITSWSLYEFRTSSASGAPSEENQVEIIFPDTIPMELASRLFTFNDDVNMPEWGFERLFITFNQDSNTMDVIFLSEDGEQQAMATVNSSEKYAQLWEYLTTFEGLRQFIRVEGAERPIYIPNNLENTSTKSITIDEISEDLMVDTVFTDPHTVQENQVDENEIYFTDSASGIMRVYTNRRTAEFQNPLQSSYEQMEPAALIKQSRMNINDHRGWTNEYNLMSVNTNASTNKVRYQMYYEGYPIFGSNYSSVIEQRYRQAGLHQYNRPLFRLVNYLGEDESVELMSGSRVIDKLSNSNTYNMDNVYDIKVGYDLTYQSNVDAVTLEPAWFMDYNGSWQKIRFNNLNPQQQEGGN
ncbi:YycH family regulatory protein [Lentibacillus jeotgali]|uniref:YycH family regulatory protein n=1 Tax=Lentibacillus jeotgali TaxID=558169 RepID=UPI0002628052|nr:two-component system activity regulator YycH [Lentibacillus jeotgali]